MPPEDNPADDFEPTQEDMAAYDEWQIKERAKERRVFTNCNVCGIKLRTDNEERMGMCDPCAKVGP